jgi:acyl carrier protein
MIMANDSEQVLAQMTGIFQTVLNDPGITLKRETTANDIEQWDSLSHIELVVAVEKHFGIKFNFAELQKFKDVGEMADSISAKLAKKGA